MSFRQTFIICPICNSGLNKIYSYSGVGTSPQAVKDFATCKKCDKIFKIKIKITKIN